MMPLTIATVTEIKVLGFMDVVIKLFDKKL